MEFSCKKTLGGKGLKPYPPLVVPMPKDGGLVHRKSGFVRFGTAGGHPGLPVSIHPFQPIYWSVYAVPSGNTSITLIHPISLLTYLSSVYLCTHPSIHLSLISYGKCAIYQAPYEVPTV